MSPGLKLASEIRHGITEEPPRAADGGDRNGPEVRIHDPNVTDSQLDLLGLERAITDADAAVITADHDEFESFTPDRFRDRMSGSVVIDTKAVLDPDAWGGAGFSFRRI
jgi:UDP-N-acetyl-D-mannosaminuronic acid dehydrogenase